MNSIADVVTHGHVSEPRRLTAQIRDEMSKEYFTKLLEHLEWANQRTLVPPRVEFVASDVGCKYHHYSNSNTESRMRLWLTRLPTTL